MARHETELQKLSHWCRDAGGACMVDMCWEDDPSHCKSSVMVWAKLPGYTTEASKTANRESVADLKSLGKNKSLR